MLHGFPPQTLLYEMFKNSHSNRLLQAHLPT